MIIGAPKCGTTSLYKYLHQHPDIYFPDIKEPQYFAFMNQRLAFRGPDVTINQAITRAEDYHALYADTHSCAAAGDASALYLSSPSAPAAIRAACPDIRLIAVLRNPVDRAYSSFMHLRRDGREPLADFAAALAAEEQRIADNWGFLWRYRSLSRYAEQVRRYLNIFDRDQLLVLLHNDLTDNPQETVARCYAHIGVDPGFRADASTRYNVSGMPRHRGLYDFMRKNRAFKRISQRVLPRTLRQATYAKINSLILQKEPLDNALRRQLLNEFRAEIQSLEILIDRDLSHWLI